MFTGALARSLGLGQAPKMEAVRPVLGREQHRLLPAVLRDSGYRTAGVSTNPWISARTGFDVGFDDFVEIDSSRQGQIDGGRKQRARWLLESALADADDGAAEARTVVDNWLVGDLHEPFFWFVNLVECHSPYLPPKPHSVSLPRRVRAADEARRYLSLKAIWRICATDETIPDAALERMRQLYAGSVRYADAWLEPLLTGLDSAGRLDDTVVIVTSDHGENLGEGGLIAHAFSVDDRLLRVPLVVAGPLADEFAGIASLAEIPGRVASIAQLDRHPWEQPSVPKIPVAQFDSITGGEAGIRRLIAEWGLEATQGEAAFERLTSSLTCAVGESWKAVRRAGVEEFFNLLDDPMELDPIAPEAAARAGADVEVLRSALDHPTVTASRPQGGADEGTSEENADLEDRMRLLGYM